MGLGLALLLLAAGGLGLVLEGGDGKRPPQALERLPRAAAPLLTGSGPIALVVVGLGLGIATLLATRRRQGAAAVELEPSEDAAPLDRRLARKTEKQARAMAKKGMVAEAAELCFTSGLLDVAAELFIEAEDWVRAAEIRHDQNRFNEAAELHLKAGDQETAGSIFASQQDYQRAAECFLEAGRMSVAAEMFEKCEDFQRAGDCFKEAGFQREAAQAYIRCHAWKQGAESLEEVVVEEGMRTGTGQDPRRQKEHQKLVLQCGKLFAQAGQLDKAEQVLERGGCWIAAAEIALQCERFARAAELFQKGNQPVRAAEVLQLCGEEQEASRILGEYHRERGEEAEAARYREAAGDDLAAGDVYRTAQDFGRAGQAYEKAGDLAQAAEMYAVGGSPGRAAANFERAGRWEEAATCYAEANEPRKQAAALARAGQRLRAGEIFHAEGLDDDAIKVLQELGPGTPEFQPASALLGEIFHARGQLSLAINKLRQALGDGELERANLRLHYTLATVYEANGNVREAVELYEKILACDYHFEDVEPRLTAARQKLAAMPQEDGPSAGDGPVTGRTQSGRYVIEGELGRGGMGIVYKAKDTVLDRAVAYKVLPDALKENPQALRNFLREAKSAAQLNHPNIVTVYDAGEQDGRYYIAMEYVDGSTLKEIVRKRGAIASGGVLHVMVQMCEALAYAHEKKIVHRDIKTANTMWTRDRKAKIMDFGLAKVVEEVRNHTTLVSGTPYYMSPEQTLGRNVDHRTDLYSLGVTLFELATGSLPFTEGNIPYHHVHTAPPDPRDVQADVPRVLAGIISRCLRKDPAERYQSARDILTEVRASVARRPSEG